MNRRDSRASVNVRQNDALLEFENFKKKFLLANRHITKLNSTLSLRIEELNAQISSLYVENLRLRASEIALAAQLKKERERSQRIMADAENATHALIKHFGAIRKNHSIPSGKPSSPSKHANPHSSSNPPRARRPPLNPEASPHANRLARPPGFPGIDEEDEDEVEPDDPEALSSSSPTPAPRSAKRNAALAPPPLPVVTTIQVDVDVDEQLLKPSGSSSRKRISRRQSGLINMGRPVSPVRPPSPAFGSPIRREAGLAEEEEELAAMSGEIEVKEEEEDAILLERAARREKKKRAKAREEGMAATGMVAEGSGARTREKRRARESEDEGASVGVAGVAEGSKSRLKDVTNSHAGRRSLPPLDTNISDHDRQHTPDSDTPSSAMTHASTSTRPVQSTPSTTPAPSYLPTPRASSPVQPTSDADAQAGGREKRVRKSINYAEPKLNTKMRKPDPQPIAGSSKRASMSSIHTTTSRSSLDAPSGTSAADVRPTHIAHYHSDSAGAPGVKRKKSRPRLPPDEDEDESAGEQADGEFPSGMRTGWVNVEGRRRSAQPGASGSGGGSRRGEADELRRHSMAV